MSSFSQCQNVKLVKLATLKHSFNLQTAKDLSFLRLNRFPFECEDSDLFLNFKFGIRFYFNYSINKWIKIIYEVKNNIYSLLFLYESPLLKTRQKLAFIGSLPLIHSFKRGMCRLWSIFLWIQTILYFERGFGVEILWTPSRKGTSSQIPFISFGGKLYC